MNEDFLSVPKQTLVKIGIYKLDLEGLKQAITPEAILVSIMAASKGLFPFIDGGVVLI